MRWRAGRGGGDTHRKRLKRVTSLARIIQRLGHAQHGARVGAVQLPLGASGRVGGTQACHIVAGSLGLRACLRDAALLGEHMRVSLFQLRIEQLYLVAQSNDALLDGAGRAHALAASLGRLLLMHALLNVHAPLHWREPCAISITSARRAARSGAAHHALAA